MGSFLPSPVTGGYNGQLTTDISRPRHLTVVTLYHIPSTKVNTIPLNCRYLALKCRKMRVSGNSVAPSFPQSPALGRLMVQFPVAALYERRKSRRINNGGSRLAGQAPTAATKDQTALLPARSRCPSGPSKLSSPSASLIRPAWVSLRA